MYDGSKVFKGMSQQEVLDLLGTPNTIDSSYYFAVRWEYDGEDNLFCANHYLCWITFDEDKKVKSTYEIDGEWLEVLSF